MADDGYENRINNFPVSKGIFDRYLMFRLSIEYFFHYSHTPKCAQSLCVGGAYLDYQKAQPLLVEVKKKSDYNCPLMNCIPILETIDLWIWQPLFILLVGLGLLLTWKLRGLQWNQLGYGLRLSVSQQDHEGTGDISNFQALTTALAATVGIGNIAGVATAIATGGVGALFWLWVTSIIGMATKYAEGVLAIRYRQTNRIGEVCGGPMYYLRDGLGWKKWAFAFAFFGALTTLATGNLVQSNSIALAVCNYFPSIHPNWIGVGLALCTGAVILGGIRSIGRITAYLVPFMALFYLVGCLIVIGVHLPQLPHAIFQIFSCAFTGQAAVGGFAGAGVMLAMQMGLSRGIFSNESGLGSGPIAAAAARTDYAARPALTSMAGAFLSTIVCTFTGLAIASSGTIGRLDAAGNQLSGAYMTVVAFEEAFPLGGIVVIISCILFGLTTIIGWSYYGEKCCEYLLGQRSALYYRLIYTAVVSFGVMIPAQMLWPIADIANACMALPNILGIFGLIAIVQEETHLFFRRKEPAIHVG